ncbi:MAG: hypothetical protein M5R42_03910 [Rhodocyclaceae bacterium]|nr:hypothetical protein [Rhodocyclaceae bacterium]
MPRPTVEPAKKPAAPESLPDIDIGGGFGKVSVIELVGFYIENPPRRRVPAATPAPAVKRFGGC